MFPPTRLISEPHASLIVMPPFCSKYMPHLLFSFFCMSEDEPGGSKFESLGVFISCSSWVR